MYYCNQPAPVWKYIVCPVREIFSFRYILKSGPVSDKITREILSKIKRRRELLLNLVHGEERGYQRK